MVFASHTFIKYNQSIHNGPNMSSLLANRMHVICLTLLWLGITTTGPVHAQIDVDKIVNEAMKEATKGMVETNAKSISRNDFRRIYGRARTSAQFKFKVQSGELKSIASEKQIETDAPGGSWRTMVAGWRGDNSSDDIYVQEAPALIMNYGRRFQYIFLSQDIKPRIYDKVNENLADLHKEIKTEFDDVEVTIGRYENKIMINASYHYVDGKGQVEDRLKFLLRQSHEMITDLLVEAPKVEKDARKELGDEALSDLNRKAAVSTMAAMNASARASRFYSATASNRIANDQRRNAFNSFNTAMNSRLTATQSSDRCQYVLTKLDDGEGLKGINLKTGAADREILLKDKKPQYDLDEMGGVLFYQKKDKELACFNIPRYRSRPIIRAVGTPGRFAAN